MGFLGFQGFRVLGVWGFRDFKFFEFVDFSSFCFATPVFEFVSLAVFAVVTRGVSPVLVGHFLCASENMQKQLAS